MKLLIIKLLQLLTDCDGMCNMCKINYCEHKLNTMKKTMLIKEKSIANFFNQHIVGIDNKHQGMVMPNGKSEEFNTRGTIGFLKDKKLYFKASCGLNPDDRVKFEYKDVAITTNSHLLCTSTYVAKTYDHLTIELNLIESTIEPFDE